MTSVNPAKTADLNARFFALQQKLFLENNLGFFQEYGSLVQKWESVQLILKKISGVEVLKLDALDGEQTIVDSKNVFSSIDPDFKAYGANTKGVATTETAVEVYEMVKDATFAQMFGSLSTDLNTLCVTQSQILNFIAKHRNMLRTEGYATFFLFKSGENFFVADVGFSVDGSLGVYVSRFARLRLGCLVSPLCCSSAAVAGLIIFIL